MATYDSVFRKGIINILVTRGEGLIRSNPTKKHCMEGRQFIAGEHYISFSSPEALQSFISYYVTKPKQAALITQNALIAARQYLSGQQFWKQASEVPGSLANLP